MIESDFVYLIDQYAYILLTHKYRLSISVSGIYQHPINLYSISAYTQQLFQNIHYWAILFDILFTEFVSIHSKNNFENEKIYFLSIKISTNNFIPSWLHLHQAAITD